MKDGFTRFKTSLLFLGSREQPAPFNGLYVSQIPRKILVKGGITG